MGNDSNRVTGNRDISHATIKWPSMSQMGNINIAFSALIK